MIKALSVLALACGTAEATKAQHPSFAEHEAHGHRVLVSSTHKSNRKYLVFPDQKGLHAKVVASAEAPAEMKIKEEEVLQMDDGFWQRHGKLLNLAEDADMVLTKSWKASGSDVVHQRYDQTKFGLRVIGGEFIASIGAHGGVMRVNGLPLSREAAAADIAASRAQLSPETVVTHVERYITERMAAGSFPARGSAKIELVSEPEMVWHNSLYAVAKEGKMTLAYQVNGLVGMNSPEIMAFDAFVSAKTGEVLQFVDKSQRGETSPFESPLHNATILVYDQWRKDLNDDVADDLDYYTDDPDR
jgi:Zn-dependent metalloprotease